MSRILKLVLTVEEEKVGGLIADLSGRVRSLDFSVEELLVRKPKKPRVNGVRKETGGLDLRQLLRSPKTVAELAALTGKSNNSIGGRLYTMKKAKLVKKLGARKWGVA